MKKIICLLIALVLISSIALAQGQQKGIHEPGTGIENPEIKEAGQGTGQGLEQEEGERVITQTQADVGVGQRIRAKTGNYMNTAGQQMKINQQVNNQFRLEVGGVSADCPFNLTQEQFQNRTRLYANLKTGRDVEIKIMPDVASETALQRLRLRNCLEKHCKLKNLGGHF